MSRGAAHAADGYARTTGKVGVCIATQARGYQPGYRARQCLYGFGAFSGYHRTGGHEPYR